MKIDDIIGLKPGQFITIRENKTGKDNILMVNKAVFKALGNYLASRRPGDPEYLFFSRKTKRPLTIQAVNALVKKWTGAVNVAGNYGAHTLRKTFGYIQRTKYRVGFEILARRFNHASPSITTRSMRR